MRTTRYVSPAFPYYYAQYGLRVCVTNNNIDSYAFHPGRKLLKEKGNKTNG